MSARDCQGVIAAQRCYIRKPGPRSEEPFTAEEWRGLIDRCVRSGRENMLDAIRLIVQGHAGAPLTQDARDALASFVAESMRRWECLIEDLPEDDVGRMPLGHYAAAFEIRDVAPAPNLNELRRRIEQARSIRLTLTGWSPFVDLHRESMARRVVGDGIEAWLGFPDEERFLRGHAHCDFWRATRDGKLLLVRGYEEDEVERVPPGAAFDITMPVWRIGEAMLFVARLSRTFSPDPTIAVRCKYKGLSRRSLVSITGLRHISSGWVASDDEIVLETQATASEIDDNLAELLHHFLTPLYEPFGFFELPMSLVTEELEALRRGRF